MKKIIIFTITGVLFSLCIVYILLIKSEHANSEVKHQYTTYNYTITGLGQESGEYIGIETNNKTEIKFKSDQEINVGDTVKIYFLEGYYDRIEKIEVVN